MATEGRTKPRRRDRGIVRASTGLAGKARERDGEDMAVLRRLRERRIGLMLPKAASWQARPQKRTLVEVSEFVDQIWGKHC